MKNSNLIATPIVNKNGVRTTVHKRDPTTTTKATELPAPDLSRAPGTGKLTAMERTAMVDDLASLFSLSSFPPEIYGNSIDSYHPLVMPFREKLENYSDELIGKLHKSSQSTDRSNGTFLLVDDDKSEEYLLTYLALHGNDYERVFETGRGWSFNLPDAVNSLATYRQLPYEHTDEYYQKATALTGVVAAIQHKIPKESHWEDHSEARYLTYTPNPEDEEESLARITSDDIIELILERPERWTQIADIITERDTTDASLIRSIIDSDTSAISEGTL
jgi:hypothetical protein